MADWSKRHWGHQSCFKTWCNEQESSPDRKKEVRLHCWTGSVLSGVIGDVVAEPRCLLSLHHWEEEFSRELIREVKCVKDCSHCRALATCEMCLSYMDGILYKPWWTFSLRFETSQTQYRLIKADPLGLKWRNQVSAKCPEIQSEPWAMMSNSSKKTK